MTVPTTDATKAPEARNADTPSILSAVASRSRTASGLEQLSTVGASRWWCSASLAVACRSLSRWPGAFGAPLDVIVVGAGAARPGPKACVIVFA